MLLDNCTNLGPMARPSVPLISKQSAVEAALRLIDERGLKGLNMRALGAELGVNAASLYHHFENKEAIERAVGEYVLDTARLTIQPDVDWRTALIQAEVAYRKGLLRHPNALALLLHLPADGTAQAFWNSLVDATRREGIPDAILATLVRALHRLTVGFAIVAMGDTEEASPPPWVAMIQGGPDDDDAFALACSALLDGFLARQGLPTTAATKGGRARGRAKPRQPAAPASAKR